MDPRLEKNFADLSVPVRGLREHFDRNHGKIIPSPLLDQNKQNEIQIDLETALQAARAGDTDWLSGNEVVAEVNDKSSPYHGRSAFRVLGRAAAFESILSGRSGRFVRCPNESIEFLSTSVKAIRDKKFRKELESLFPETVLDRATFLKNIEIGLTAACGDADTNVLTGEEVLRQKDHVDSEYQCENTERLDIFWGTALVNAWLSGVPTPDVRDQKLSVSVATPPPVLIPTPLASRPVPPSSGASYPDFLKSTPVRASNPLGVFGVDDLTWQIGTDMGFGGGGVFLQRGVVTVVRANFEKEILEGGGVRAKFVSMYRFPEPLDRKGAQIEALDKSEFLKKSRQAKWFRKAEKEATLLFRQPDFKELTVARTLGERGWIQGTLGLRRIAGLAGIVYGLGDAGFRFFRGDGRGLDGPLTDAGVDPLGARLALVGAGVGAAVVTILTGGLSLVGALVLGGVTAGGASLELHHAFEEEGIRKFQQDFIPLDRDASPQIPNDSTISPDLIASLNESPCNSHRADSGILTSNR